mmetsp:Transcript_85646/g.245811  ORF Transcript_85646/g.245811 Transcript_85646/m.245811 type:complete len:589 (+) Transcript_85646:50-1816(+)
MAPRPPQRTAPERGAADENDPLTADVGQAFARVKAALARALGEDAAKSLTTTRIDSPIQSEFGSVRVPGSVTPKVVRSRPSSPDSPAGSPISVRGVVLSPSGNQFVAAPVLVEVVSAARRVAGVRPIAQVEPPSSPLVPHRLLQPRPVFQEDHQQDGLQAAKFAFEEPDPDPFKIRRKPVLDTNVGSAMRGPRRSASPQRIRQPSLSPQRAAWVSNLSPATASRPAATPSRNRSLSKERGARQASSPLPFRSGGPRRAAPAAAVSPSRGQREPSEFSDATGSPKMLTRPVGLNSPQFLPPTALLSPVLTKRELLSPMLGTRHLVTASVSSPSRAQREASTFTTWEFDHFELQPVASGGPPLLAAAMLASSSPVQAARATTPLRTLGPEVNYSAPTRHTAPARYTAPAMYASPVTASTSVGPSATQASPLRARASPLNSGGTSVTYTAPAMASTVSTSVAPASPWRPQASPLRGAAAPLARRSSPVAYTRGVPQLLPQRAVSPQPRMVYRSHARSVSPARTSVAPRSLSPSILQPPVGLPPPVGLTTFAWPSWPPVVGLPGMGLPPPTAWGGFNGLRPPLPLWPPSVLR